MTSATIERLTASRNLSVRMVTTLAQGLGLVSRRSLLVNVAIAGSALVVHPKSYALKPGRAYDAVCGPNQTAAAGYTVFCCTVNNGANTCPPGTFSGGWWKAADSSWCCGGFRYIVDCNATCSSCSAGCSDDHICSDNCWNCSCGKGDSSTCDQRLHCCNAFRYGQCNTQIRCSGGVACRVVSCVPPYRWDNCSTTTLTDNSTSEHNAPCLQGCGPILTAYNALGANGSALGGSLGPERPIGDGRGKHVDYEHGTIVWSQSTGAHALIGDIASRWQLQGGLVDLGYPLGEQVVPPGGAGLLQEFERGLIASRPRLGTHTLRGSIRARWRALGGAASLIGFPTSDELTIPNSTVVHQEFEHGSLYLSATGPARVLKGAARALWLRMGGITSPLGLPLGEEVPTGLGSRQTFEYGGMAWSSQTGARPLLGVFWTRWLADGGGASPTGFPVTPQQAGRDGRGNCQGFTGGELWSLAGQPARLLSGPVLAAWYAEGAETSHWGYPLSDGGTATQSATFEGGVLIVAAGPPPAGS